MIPFNKPYLTGKETQYIEEAVKSGKISGNGMFTQKCQSFFEEQYGFQKVLLTTSCTDALEMCAILADIQLGDEVIIPSFTFVSTAIAFVRQGAKIVFADSLPDNPNIDVSKLEALITPKTKVIVPVHYAGVACDMDPIMELADKYNLLVIEDAAQAIDSSYNGKPLGTFGHMAAFSFHETKNIIAGEGGMITINDKRFIHRAEIIWEKGTNRAEFFRGEVNKYGWVDIGSSFLPSEVIAAFLWAQIENLEIIQKKRISHWHYYHAGLKKWAEQKDIKIMSIPNEATNNGHMFYLVCKSIEQRSTLIEHLKNEGVLAVFHYISLHSSPYYNDKHNGRELVNSDMFTDRLLRLPMFYELDVESVVNKIIKYE
ncbi:dTDP-4-amino-4,6-dideoxygalactose transaminase [Flavobacterium gilvum]|uniref:dTDP-4-amino-4,6-dideoxygalactose transaminase n=1 Tax=Flavobacterium gilvum TaxID=1492737 RepID=A0AAC9I3F9_9FLAO|nr:dTDP-4-amino-4,6-dideoxygalactose transaminase [Flavobacterium gilvum]AOW08118.1 dTDP-4-amino-4,6-dideoxygalactose transaminase [Flavobacterium gilvum]KFC58889.1 TDP-4-oxo-6-deoxy-D-glucose aminotransferase [Flavobacterium gilvum]